MFKSARKIPPQFKMLCAHALMFAHTDTKQLEVALHGTHLEWSSFTKQLKFIA